MQLRSLLDANLPLPGGLAPRITGRRCRSGGTFALLTRYVAVTFDHLDAGLTFYGWTFAPDIPVGSASVPAVGPYG